MHVEWYGQSAFRLQAGDMTVVIDPFGDMSAARGARDAFDYPPIDGVTADLLLVTHEHRDHNGVEVVGGDPATDPLDAGHASSTPVGEVVGDRLRARRRRGHAARRERDVRVHARRRARGAPRRSRPVDRCAASRRAALGPVDLLFVPVGDGPTIGAALAARDRGARSARAGSCRCTTARSASTSSSRSTRSWSAQNASQRLDRVRSKWTRCPAATARSSSCPPRPDLSGDRYRWNTRAWETRDSRSRRSCSAA